MVVCVNGSSSSRRGSSTSYRAAVFRNGFQEWCSGMVVVGVELDHLQVVAIGVDERPDAGEWTLLDRHEPFNLGGAQLGIDGVDVVDMEVEHNTPRYLRAGGDVVAAVDHEPELAEPDR